MHDKFLKLGQWVAVLKMYYITCDAIKHDIKFVFLSQYTLGVPWSNSTEVCIMLPYSTIPCPVCMLASLDDLLPKVIIKSCWPVSL